MMDVSIFAVRVIAWLLDPIQLAIAAGVIFVAYKWVRWLIRTSRASEPPM